MPNTPKHYQEKAHQLLRAFLAARDAYVATVNRDDTTHPVRDRNYERQFAELHALITDALRHRDR